MKTEKLNYELPTELIAQKPVAKRAESRLMILGKSDGAMSEGRFGDVIDFLKSGDCLVINETKVLAAKFFAQRSTGGKIEGLFIETTSEGIWRVMLKNAGKVKISERLNLLDRDLNKYCEIIAVERLGGGEWVLEICHAGGCEEILADVGLTPLPPYIKRADPAGEHDFDVERYQTIYAVRAGAVAAPTAGLHFTKEIFARLKTKGVKIARLTLHVGIGTFKPVTAEELHDHDIHYERYAIGEMDAKIINETIDGGGRIIAVGTTSVRTLETVADTDGKVCAGTGETNLFIMPGYKFKVVDGIITNFHLPKSTLIALIAAFASLEQVMAAYRYAIEKKFRFYSYGDAMLII